MKWKEDRDLLKEYLWQIITFVSKILENEENWDFIYFLSLSSFLDLFYTLYKMKHKVIILIRKIKIE